MHDYDNNTKLDGLELLKSMTHHHDEDDHGEGDLVFLISIYLSLSNCSVH